MGGVEPLAGCDGTQKEAGSGALMRFANYEIVDCRTDPFDDQPNGGRTDILQKEDHGAGLSHTRDPNLNTDPQTGQTFINGLTRPGRPVSYDDIQNIINGTAKPSPPKGR